MKRPRDTPRPLGRADFCKRLADLLIQVGSDFSYRMSDPNGNTQAVSDMEKLLIKTGRAMFNLAVTLRDQAAAAEPLPLFEGAERPRQDDPTKTEPTS